MNWTKCGICLPLLCLGWDCEAPRPPMPMDADGGPPTDGGTVRYAGRFLFTSGGSACSSIP